VVERRLPIGERIALPWLHPYFPQLPKDNTFLISKHSSIVVSETTTF